MSSTGKANTIQCVKAQNSGQDTTVRIQNFCPKIMIHFCHLNQWNSDSNSFKLYPNIRFYHLQPLNDFYCYIRLSFLIILDEMKDS